MAFIPVDNETLSVIAGTVITTILGFFFGRKHERKKTEKKNRTQFTAPDLKNVSTK